MSLPKRYEIDLKQVKSLLTELRKAKLKCLQLCEHLNKDLPNLQKYQILSVRCTRTAESMDQAGLINLQNQLAQSLAQLYQAERDLLYQAEKNSFKKIVGPTLIRRQRQYFSKQEVGPFKVPNYYGRPEQSINKIERISNFIQSIGKSMDSLRKAMENQGQWNLSDFLQYQPEYLELKRRIERYKMRDEQIIQSLQVKVQQQTQRLINEGQKVEEGEDYVLMKIPKRKIDKYGKTQQPSARQRRHDRSADNLEHGYHPYSMLEPKKKSPMKKSRLQKITQQVAEPTRNQNNTLNVESNNMELHITSFQKNPPPLSYNSRASRLSDSSQLDQDESGNFVYMVRKISPDSQLNSSILSSISSLRSLRKKVFDDDVWDQFQKF